MYACNLLSGMIQTAYGIVSVAHKFFRCNDH